jgi:hypothetical protein
MSSQPCNCLHVQDTYLATSHQLLYILPGGEGEGEEGGVGPGEWGGGGQGGQGENGTCITYQLYILPGGREGEGGGREGEGGGREGRGMGGGRSRTRRGGGGGQGERMAPALPTSCISYLEGERRRERGEREERREE